MTEERRRSARLSNGSNNDSIISQPDAALQTRVAQLEQEIQDHLLEADRQQATIISLTDQLSEKELLLIDTNAKLDDLAVKLENKPGVQVKICMFTDVVTSNIMPESIIPAKQQAHVKIVKESSTYSKLCNQIDSGHALFQGGNFDLLILALGGEDLLVNSNTDDLVSKAGRVINKLLEYSHVCIVQVPPNDIDGKRAEPRVFNRRLEGKVGGEVQKINVDDLNKKSFRDILLNHRTLSDQGVSTMSQIIKCNLIIPEPGSHNSQKLAPVPDSTEQYTALCSFPTNKVGLFLGKKGTNTAEWYRKHKVKVSVGVWFERNKQAENGLSNVAKFEGALVTGTLTGIRAVAQDTQTMLSNDTRPDENSTKKVKYF